MAQVGQFKRQPTRCMTHERSSFSSVSATILEDKDRKGRPRIRVLPARNNANVAPMPQRYGQLAVCRLNLLTAITQYTDGACKQWKQ